MLGWAITFLVLAIIASLFGFGGMVGTFPALAKLLAVLFLVLFVASLIYNIVSGRRGTDIRHA